MAKRSEMGPTKVKMKAKDPQFFLLCKYQKVPRAYESHNPALTPTYQEQEFFASKSWC